MAHTIHVEGMAHTIHVEGMAHTIHVEGMAHTIVTVSIHGFYNFSSHLGSHEKLW